MIRCRYCGTENLDDAVYCDECAKNLTPFSNQPSVESVNPETEVSPRYAETLRANRKVFDEPARSRGIKQYVSLLRSFLRSYLNGAEDKTPFPFVRHRIKNEIEVPLIQSFRFIHEPIGMATSSRFIGRQDDLESLAERILFSEGGSFLVTGYRGVGKTSFVNQVVRTLEGALPWAERSLGKTEIVDIYLNVARPIQPSEMMHHIIRRLHDRLLERDIYALLDPGLQQSLTLAYHRTSVNMARKLAESSETSFGFNEASIGGDWMKASLKMSLNSKRNRSQNHEMSYLGYDDKAAEHDVISIARGLTLGYIKPHVGWNRVKAIFTASQPPRVRLKIVFVFDELDKLEEFTTTDKTADRPIIDQILGSLKNLFTTSGVSFIFVAGKDLQERWLEDVGKGDSVYESVFSYDKYLKCLWADVDGICDGLIKEYDVLPSYSRKVYQEFKKYLTYKGRGIPRRIIRTFNEYVEWNGDQPVLAFSKPIVRRIRFFAGLQDVLNNNARLLFGEAHEEVAGTQSDKRRLGVYYLIDWILRQASSEFRLKDLLSASKRLSAKIALAEEVLPHVATDILKILLDADYIQELRSSLDRVVIDKANAIEDARAVDETRYMIAPRRLGEIGGLAADVELEGAYTHIIREALESKEKINSIGKFEFVRLLGRGGMGSVFEAMDKENGRRVAIKVTGDDAGPEMLRRFEREAIIMKELDHPNVVKAYAWGQAEGQMYIAMEYLEGLTLEELINRQGKLDLDLVIAIARPVAQAAHYIHERGFVRNDIKPSNIMLTSAGRVCLLDFGITRPATSKPELKSMFDTGTRVIIGTPQFMAPEQFGEHGDQSIDRRSDIFSLGVVLYRMLTGHYPFDNKRFDHLARGRSDQTIIMPSHYAEVPAAIDKVILKCLEKDPDKRFQTMNELEASLCTAAGDLAPVDLRSVVNIVQIEVEQIQAINNQATVEPSAALSAPVSRAEAPRGTTDGVDQAIPISREFALRTLAPTVPVKLRDDIHPAVRVQDYMRPSITLLSGRVEDIDFHVTVANSTYKLEKETKIGRGSDNDVVLRSAKISRYHGKCDSENGDWFVEDLNSYNGIYVNGEKVFARCLLTEGDKIQLGDFFFRFNQALH